MVSIPHRQSKNAIGLTQVMPGTAFQFLIGSLKTNTSEWVDGLKLVFQFLIGSLKTAVMLSSLMVGMSFNSS